MLDVLPRALVAAASGVRAASRDLEPVRAGSLGDPSLTGALASFASAWGGAVASLSAEAEQCADDLAASAREYVRVESLLVPVALR